MKTQRFMLAALVVAGAWSLTLGTVAVVHLGRLVDALTLATAAPASNGAGRLRRAAGAVPPATRHLRHD